MTGRGQDYGGRWQSWTSSACGSNSPTIAHRAPLKEREGSRHLPIWIGAAEASAIAYAQQGVVPPRQLDSRPDGRSPRPSLERPRPGRDHREPQGRAFHAVLVLSSEAGHETRVDRAPLMRYALAARGADRAGESRPGRTGDDGPEVSGGRRGDRRHAGAKTCLPSSRKFLDPASRRTSRPGSNVPTEHDRQG